MIMDGEDIGSMIDSDYENLQVDAEFERLRHNLEVPSTLGDEEQDADPQFNLMSVRSYESYQRKQKYQLTEAQERQRQE